MPMAYCLFRFMEERGLPLAADMAVPEDERERRERERRNVSQQFAAQRQPPRNRNASDALQFYRNDRKVCPAPVALVRPTACMHASFHLSYGTCLPTHLTLQHLEGRLFCNRSTSLNVVKA